MKSCANKIFFLIYSFFRALPRRCVKKNYSPLDYSDENGNVSGEDDDGDEKLQHKHHYERDNEISPPTRHDHNEIEKPVTTTTTTAATTTTTQRTSTIMPCDADNGGCDQGCQMVIDEYDTEARIQCSCDAGYILDENDGRRCHGMLSKINLN
jgi:hypothetical protein